MLLLLASTAAREPLATDPPPAPAAIATPEAEPAAAAASDATSDAGAAAAAVPVILWNARLEEDKQPEVFCALLARLRQASERAVIYSRRGWVGNFLISSAHLHVLV